MVAHRGWLYRTRKISGLASDTIYSSNFTILFSAFISFAVVVVVVLSNDLFVVWRFWCATSGGEGSDLGLSP